MNIDFPSHFNPGWLNKLLVSPENNLSGNFADTRYQARIIIPYYKQKVASFYQQYLDSDIDQYCRNHHFPLVFQHFGIEIKFESPLQLRLHDDEMMMNTNMHQLIKEAGAVIIKNAYLDSEHRSMGHRNRFPQLNFHVDRSENQPTHYSMYTRNPFDDEQKYPRTSSTLFVSSIIGHLQELKENTANTTDKIINKGSYTIFTPGTVPELVNQIIVEHAWNEPPGTGEISMIDNITCLHASYYPSHEKGYKIGVRYVG